MRHWVVGSAIIEAGEGDERAILLVRNRRRSGALEWSTPGGVIDEGETMLQGLAREVREETGLSVTGWDGPAYEVEVAAADLGWQARVEVWRATGFRGQLHVDDPDGIVVDARFVRLAACGAHLDGGPRWVSEPFAEWLAAHAAAASMLPFRYDVAGVAPSFTVTRRE